jgi:hypothetical protein
MSRPLSKPKSKPAAASPASAVSPQQALEFMQKMWNPLGLPLPGFAPPSGAASGTALGAPTLPFPNPALMFAALDPAEVQRRIDELRIVENWLTMSLSMLQMSVKTLELQKASLDAMRSGVASTPPRPRK